MQRHRRQNQVHTARSDSKNHTRHEPAHDFVRRSTRTFHGTITFDLTATSHHLFATATGHKGMRRNSSRSPRNSDICFNPSITIRLKNHSQNSSEIENSSEPTSGNQNSMHFTVAAASSGRLSCMGKKWLAATKCLAGEQRLEAPATAVLTSGFCGECSYQQHERTSMPNTPREPF